MTTHPRFVIGVLTPEADIMQIYSSLMIGGCSEISFVKDINSSLLCRAASIEKECSLTNQRHISPPRKRMRDEISPASSSVGLMMPSQSDSSPDNLNLVLNGIIRQQELKREEESASAGESEGTTHSPSLPDAMENAPLLLSRVFGMGNGTDRTTMCSLDDEQEDHMTTPHFAENENGLDYGSGKRKGPVVECMKCSSKIIMQQTRSLFRHIMTHASQEPYKCSDCLQSSANSFNLRTHIFRKHGGAAKIIPNRTVELEAEWRNLARECFPLQQERIDRCISYFVNSGENMDNKDIK